MLTYKGFVGQIEFDAEKQTIVGEVINAPDVILFSGPNVKELEADFKRRIDDYLAFHEFMTQESAAPLVSRYTLCLDADQQKRLLRAAEKEDVSVLNWLTAHIDEALTTYPAKAVAKHSSHG